MRRVLLEFHVSTSCCDRNAAAAGIAKRFVTVGRRSKAREILDTGLKGKTVLITGASRNTGRMAALAFVHEGANLAICARQKLNELDEVAAGTRALGVKVVAELCGVTNHDRHRPVLFDERRTIFSIGATSSASAISLLIKSPV